MNRLTEVKKFTSGTQTQDIAYAYDMFGQLVSRTLTNYTGGVAGTPSTANYVYGPNGNMTLAFVGGTLTDRYLSGPAIDQILADESISTGSTWWTATDDQGTVKDLLAYNSETGTSVASHLAYSPFGALDTTDSSGLDVATVDFLFGYTGTWTDPDTGLQWHNDPSSRYTGRWYNTAIQQWMGEDPSGLDASPNPYDYCGNSPTCFVDPTGLAEVNPGATLSGGKDQPLKDNTFVYGSGGVAQVSVFTGRTVTLPGGVKPKAGSQQFFQIHVAHCDKSADIHWLQFYRITVESKTKPGYQGKALVFSGATQNKNLIENNKLYVDTAVLPSDKEPPWYDSVPQQTNPINIPVQRVGDDASMWDKPFSKGTDNWNPSLPPDAVVTLTFVTYIIVNGVPRYQVQWHTVLTYQDGTMSNWAINDISGKPVAQSMIYPSMSGDKVTKGYNDSLGGDIEFNNPVPSAFRNTGSK